MAPTYRYDDKLIIRPTEMTPVINFDNLKQLLLSPITEANLKSYESLVSQKQPKFLDGKVNLDG